MQPLDRTIHESLLVGMDKTGVTLEMDHVTESTLFDEGCKYFVGFTWEEFNEVVALREEYWSNGNIRI